MATDLERLVVQLSADMKGFEKALNKANGVANSRARAIENRFRKMNSSINAGLGTLANGAMRAFAVIGGAQGFRTLSDSATRITNSLKVAGLEGEVLEGVYQKLLVSAQKNAAPLEALIELYGRASLVQNELGVSSEQLIMFTNNIAVALRASGKSSQEASGALLQLSQALGSGVVRAEEFNSIQEGAPTILQAAAAGIAEAGGSVAKLRSIMLDGGLSSKGFFDGIAAGAPLLEQKLAGAVLTIDQRFENLNTALIDAARRFNESTNAADTFGAEIDRVASFVNGLEFDSIFAEIQRIADQFNVAIKAANNFAAEMGKLSGLEWVGEKFVEMLPGEGASKSFFGGALTVTSSKGIADRINQAFDHEIQQAGELTSEAIRNSVLGRGDVTNAGSKATRVPEAPKVTPITLSDPKYAAPPSKIGGSSKGGRGGGSRSSSDSFEREIQQIQQRTAAIQAETAAQANLNPLLNDYGFALEQAAAKNDLLNAAKQAGLIITPELEANIDKLATAYANAGVQAEQLAEKQDQVRQAADEFKNMAADATKGFISDLRSGKSAAEALRNALDRVVDSLINMAINSMFGLGGGGGGGLLSLFGFKDGGYIKGYARGGNVRGPGTGRSDSILAKLSNGEFVINAKATKQHRALLERINNGQLPAFADGGPVGAFRAPSMPSIPAMTPSRASNDTVTVVLRDDSGRMAAIADQQIQSASGTIVRISVAEANKSAPTAVAKYQGSKGGADYRMG